jgi:hypothetical protein
MLSAALMLRRLLRAVKYARHEENFDYVFGAAIALIVIGTLTYRLGTEWSIVDSFYFAVATLTTSSIADPELTIADPWLKIFTVFYILIGIGILVELIRRVGNGFMAVREQDKAAKAAKQQQPQA